MKKVLFIFALIGMFSFVTPKTATALEPGTYTLYCVSDGEFHYVFCHDDEDRQAWTEILC